MTDPNGPTDLDSYTADGSGPLQILSEMDSLNNFRTLKNLGSRILDVRPFQNKDHSGYQVIYNEGDDCIADPGRQYQSHVKYQCDPDGFGLNDFP